MPKEKPFKGIIRGEVVVKPLSLVKPNTWNPNKMTATMLASLEHGLRHDGWLKSQSLLVWGKDKRGKVRNIIIDGEHRWKKASEMGFKEAPMVFLDGLTEAEAKALTIKFIQKHGEPEEPLMKDLLQDLSKVLEPNDMAVELGFAQEDLMSLLSTGEDLVAGPSNAPPPPSLPSGLASTSVKIVQLFFQGDEHAKFEGAVRKLAEKHGTKNISDTVRMTVFQAAGV